MAGLDNKLATELTIEWSTMVGCDPWEATAAGVLAGLAAWGGGVAARPGDAGTVGRGGAREAPSVQETSAGRIRVAIWPAWAAASARIASWARSRGWPLVWTQPDTVRARASMSDWSGAS